MRQLNIFRKKYITKFINYISGCKRHKITQQYNRNKNIEYKKKRNVLYLFNCLIN